MKHRRIHMLIVALVILSLGLTPTDAQAPEWPRFPRRSRFLCGTQ